MSKKKTRRGHFCKVCHGYLPNERFSGKGHRTHVCKACQKLPKDTRFHIEAMDTMWGFLSEQSHISKKNRTRLTEFAAAEDPEVRRFAAVVLEVARRWPSRRRRYRGVRANHPELLKRLIEVGILDDYDRFEGETDWPPYPEELGLCEDLCEGEFDDLDCNGEDDPRSSRDWDDDIPF